MQQQQLHGAAPAPRPTLTTVCVAAEDHHGDAGVCVDSKLQEQQAAEHLTLQEVGHFE